MIKSDKNTLLSPESELRCILLDNPSLFTLFETMGVQGVFGRKSIREVCKLNNLHESVVLPLLEVEVNKDFCLHEALPAYGLLQLCDWLLAFAEVVDSQMKAIQKQFGVDFSSVGIAYSDHLEELKTTLLPHVREMYELYYSPDYTSGKSDLLTFSVDFFPVKSLPLDEVSVFEDWVEENCSRGGLFAVHTVFQHIQTLERIENNLLIPMVQRMEEEIITTFQKNRVKPQRMAYLQPDEPDADPLPLSKRESEVLQFLAKGLKNKEIADVMNISLTTVISHRKHIVERLGIKSLAGLTVYAYLHGMLEEDILTNED